MSLMILDKARYVTEQAQHKSLNQLDVFDLTIPVHVMYGVDKVIITGEHYFYVMKDRATGVSRFGPMRDLREEVNPYE